MKKIFLLLLIFCACAPKEKIEPPPAPTVVDEKVNRIVYEGIIKKEYAEGPVELFLDESQTGLTSSFSKRLLIQLNPTAFIMNHALII